MVIIITLLLIMNFAALIYIIRVFQNTLRGKDFLNYAKGMLSENDEFIEVGAITNIHLPLFEKFLLGTKTMMYFIVMTILINLITILFGIYPELAVSTAWPFITGVTAILNAFIIISFKLFINAKAIINATCEAYDVLLKSYDYIKEYTGDDNVGVK